MNPAYLEAAFDAGATGYVLKSAAHEELVQAVDTVLRGDIFLSTSIPGECADLVRSGVRRIEHFALTSRERETLQLIAEGRAAKEIAHILDISPKTVSFHRENIKRRLGLRSTADLTKYAIENGLIACAPRAG